MKPTLNFWLGAAAGGAAGFLVCWAIARQQGLQLAVLPGVMAGWGATFGRCRSWWPPVVVGVSALGLSILTEWWVTPFIQDDSLVFFLKHLDALPGIKKTLLALGGLAGYWIAKDARIA